MSTQKLKLQEISDLYVLETQSVSGSGLALFSGWFSQDSSGRPSGSGLWITDGTDAGTNLLRGFPNARLFPEFITPLGDTEKFLFLAEDITNLTGQELWVTDGTPAGTNLVKDIHPNVSRDMTSPGYNSPRIPSTVAFDNFADLGYSGKAIFRADNGSNGLELWVTDGTEQGTNLVKDINLAGDSNPRHFESIGSSGKAIFSADDGVHGIEPWITDGTPEGTFLLKDINPQGSGAIFAGVTDIYGSLGNTGKVVFPADDGVNGYDLWVTDGTATGTSLLKDINAFSFNFTELGNTGKLIFSVPGGTWVTDGTSDGTKFVLSEYSNGFIPTGQTGQTLSFFYGGLSISDGTSEGTNLIKKDIFGHSLTPLGKTNYFVFTGYSESEVDEPWITNGTSEGTSLLVDINPSGASYPNEFTELGNTGKVIFITFIEDETGGREANNLWITDGNLPDLTVTLSASDDTHIADDSRNIINAGSGNDVVFGLGNNDYLVGNDGDDSLFGNAGSDSLEGNNGNDFLSSGKDDDLVEGHAGDDRIFGNLGNDKLLGNDGNDSLFGGQGNDDITGGPGNDFISGDFGNDVLVGHTGADIFAFLPGHGSDIIADFKPGEDKIAVVEGSYAQGFSTPLSINDLTISNNPSGFVTVSFAGELIATVNDITALSASDFISFTGL